MRINIEGQSLPEVYLDQKTHEQVFDYCDAIGADYAMVCNGYEMYCYKYSEKRMSMRH